MSRLGAGRSGVMPHGRVPPSMPSAAVLICVLFASWNALGGASITVGDPRRPREDGLAHTGLF
ncbi:MAG: hypothetical protein IJT75_04250 [Bacteroidaceae bacterium]|nr:hypothetical protein [Bacteroidaceae bacterium]